MSYDLSGRFKLLSSGVPEVHLWFSAMMRNMTHPFFQTLPNYGIVHETFWFFCLVSNCFGFPHVIFVLVNLEPHFCLSLLFETCSAEAYAAS